LMSLARGSIAWYQLCEGLNRPARDSQAMLL
jgi:hypothetical protein